MLEYKVIKFPPLLFSAMSNTPVGRKTHAPNSHRWKPLSWFCLLRWRPWTFQSTAGATVEWQWSNSSSISNCLYPFWAWHTYSLLSVFFEMGWLPVWILDNFCFFEMGWFPIRILDNFCFVEMGWFPIRILDNFRFSPNFEMGWFLIRILDNFRFSLNWE